MNSSDTLLATLSQSSAVMVAIIGGFLVSRLVALSSEREGIRRQLREARERLALLQADYQPVHEHRLENSKRAFYGWVLNDLVEAGGRDVDLDALVGNNIPRGSSADEMRPYAEELIERVRAAFVAVRAHVRPDDTNDLSLDDLQQRGLRFDEREEDIYWDVVDRVTNVLPDHKSWSATLASISTGAIRPTGTNVIEARRLDESIRSEMELKAQIITTQKEVHRLEDELTRLGKPVGVVSAVWVLALLSLFGIVLPVIVMATEPRNLSVWMKVTLIGLFVVGLVAVLGYILWYLKHLNWRDK